MNNRADLQYLSDTILIDRIACLELGITKQAGLSETLGLGGIANSITDWVQNYIKENVKTDSASDIGISVLQLLAPAILFRINPFVGILYEIASAYGFDIQGIISKIREGRTCFYF